MLARMNLLPLVIASIIRFIAAGGVLLLMCIDVDAALVTYTFTGTVSAVDARLSGTFNTS